MVYLFSKGQDVTLHILQREGKGILPLTWLNFVVLSTWPNLPAGMAA